ncbi:MAG: hypothetical protein AABW59_00055 [archaeon]
MKKLCFVEMEGVLLSSGAYAADGGKAKDFIGALYNFCKSNKIELYLISGFHEPVAHKKFESSYLSKIFDKSHFICVDEKYICSKAEQDQKIHREKLLVDPEFCDSYHKQVMIKEMLAKNNLSPGEALLLADDFWVDGYYSVRFSKIDFAIFEENMLDRGKPFSERIQGMAYFTLDFDSAKLLLENFPKVDLKYLDKFVFETMKNLLVGDSLKQKMIDAAKKKAGNKK